jgi:hypothetical protein
MSEAIWRRGVVAMAGLVLTACLPGPVAAPAPKPAPEPPQTPPSAEALAPIRVIEPVCAQPPRNGEILEGAVAAGTANNYYEIVNNTDAKAIVRIRRGGDGPMVVAVYVAPRQTATIGPLAAGVYRQTQAMGADFAPDCRHLDFPSGYGQFDRSDVFGSGEGEDGEAVGRTQTYVLEENDVDGGDGPQVLTAEKFNAP